MKTNTDIARYKFSSKAFEVDFSVLMSSSRDYMFQWGFNFDQIKFHYGFDNNLIKKNKLCPLIVASLLDVDIAF